MVSLTRRVGSISGEMPPKKGRGRGKKRPEESTSSRPESSHTDHRGRGSYSDRGQVLYSDQGRAGKHAPSSESEESQKHRTETVPAYGLSSLPSTSGYEDSRKEHKVIPEVSSPSDDGHFVDTTEITPDYGESPKTSKHSIEKPCDYVSPSTSGAKQKSSRKEHKVSAEDIGIKFDEKFSEALLLPKRPGVGNVGRRIKVVSNCYSINFPTGYVYHYDIEIIENNQRKSSNPEHKKYRCLNTKRNREVIAFMLKHNPEFEGFYAVFDGQKNLLTRKELEIKLPFRCNVMLPREDTQEASGKEKYDDFKVQILSLVSKINLDSIGAFYHKKCSDLPQEAIMAVETILRHGPCMKFTPIGRSFYFPPDPLSETSFGGGLEIWYGYHQSIRLGQWGPTVNLNISATTFWESGSVLAYIAKFMNRSKEELKRLQSLNKNDVRQMNRKLKQRQVKVTHLSYGRKYRIVRLRELSANQEYVDNRDSSNKTRKTVAQYFKETYGKELEYANLPCLQVQPEKKNVYLPVEVCQFVEGQHYKGEITKVQKEQMVRFTSRSPHQRFKEIQDIVRTANFNGDEVVKNFGLKVSDRPVIADARVLNSPNLVYKDRYEKNEKIVFPKQGSWDMRNAQFFHGAAISHWVLLSFYKDDNLKPFADFLVETGNNLGMDMKEVAEIRVLRDINCDKKQLFRGLKEKGIKLAVIVIPKIEEKREKRLYAEIKKVAETEVGLPTQCINFSNLRKIIEKKSRQIASNLCLKINAKLGGENHSLLKCNIPIILRKPVIIIGADVNHPAPTQPNQPSIAACVGSLDCFGKRFAVSIRAQVHSKDQKKTVEEIVDLEVMIRDLLLAFYHHTRNQKPEKIIFYRDGVSEGELATVKNKEIISIRKACQGLGKEYQPGITAIVVQKRHHVRFKPMDGKGGVGKLENIEPGTVIDTDVTHPVNSDFFLCSQYGLKGTSRPSHYLVIEDDNNLSADDLQVLTYHMCHMYARCTRTISIPAPVAYADLVAYRARKHLDYKKEVDASNSDCSKTYRLTQSDISAIQVVDELKDSMYFV